MKAIKLLLDILKRQLFTRAKLAFQIILYFLPLYIVIKVIGKYEDDMPDGLAEVIYLLLGFGILGLVIFMNIRKYKKES